MDLQELTLPIRAYWDLSPAQQEPVDAVRISRELADIKILHLGITDTADRPSNSLPPILEQLSSKGMAVSLTLSASLPPTSLSSLLSHNAVRMILFAASAVSDLQSCALRVKEAGQGSARSGISFLVNRRNLENIPEVAAFCLDRRIHHLVFPIQRLCSNEEPFVLSSSERESLSRRLSVLNRDGLHATIHDPFLWRAWHPTAAFPDGRCQAGNTMIYISSPGTVYPCPALPHVLGSLRDRSLKEILSSEEKKRTRELIIAAASECCACHQLETCKGGCRGRALVMQGSFDFGDPACK